MVVYNQLHNTGIDEEVYLKKYEGIAEEDMPDRAYETLVDKNVLITGGAGFVGKVLIEKILRTCYGVNKIYIMIRGKKGKNPTERIEEIFSSPLYDLVKEQQGADILERKVIPIVGDIMLPDIGLSPEDRELLIEDVDFVFHLAATIRFIEPLKKAILLNTRGTLLMVNLAKEMKKCEFFCHVSTAYCHPEQKVLQEKEYPCYVDPYKMIEMVEIVDENVLEGMKYKILGSCPNTYAFSKNLSETIVMDAIRSGLPACIVRPSLVIPIWKEPFPGWTDNINGPVGLLIGAAKGVIRTMYCEQEDTEYADLVPVDIVANGLLIALVGIVYFKESRHVGHLTTSHEVHASWNDILNIGRKVIYDIPFNWIVWFPGGSLKKSRLYHEICVFFFHMLPAVIIDFFLILFGFNGILMKVQRKVLEAFDIFEYYGNNCWKFENSLVYEARMRMNPREKKIYIVDGNDVDLYDYYTKLVIGARKYLLNEKPETLPMARIHTRVMYVVDILVKVVLFYYLIQYLSQNYEFFYSLVSAIWKTDEPSLQSSGFKLLPNIEETQ